MIAAGVADRVGLSLTTIAESRVEAMNFPNAQFADTDFTYDWSAPPSDLGQVFLDAFNARNRAMGDRVWLTESSVPVDLSNLTFLAMRLPPRTGFPVDGGAADGGVTTSPVDDVRVAFMGIGARATATRLRADLPARMLDRDLDLAASDLGVRDRTYTFGRELNRPAFSTCPFPFNAGGDAPGEAPRDASSVDAGGDPAGDAGGDDASEGADAARPEPTPAAPSGGIQCAASRPGGSDDEGAALLAGVGALAIALGRRVRRRA